MRQRERDVKVQRGEKRPTYGIDSPRPVNYVEHELWSGKAVT